MIAWLTGKIKLYAAIAGAVAVAILTAFLRGRAEGSRSAAAKRREADAKIQERFDEIDRQRPDFDAAIDRLHGRVQHDRSKRR